MEQGALNSDLLNKAIDALYNSLKSCRIPSHIELDKENAKNITIASLTLDSLDLLQMAMDVEEILNIEIDNVTFSGDITLHEVAENFVKIMEQGSVQ